jgi:hypothetical protein
VSVFVDLNVIRTEEFGGEKEKGMVLDSEKSEGLPRSRQLIRPGVLGVGFVAVLYYTP